MNENEKKPKVELDEREWAVLTSKTLKDSPLAGTQVEEAAKAEAAWARACLEFRVGLCRLIDYEKGRAERGDQLCGTSFGMGTVAALADVIVDVFAATELPVNVLLQGIDHRLKTIGKEIDDRKAVFRSGRLVRLDPKPTMQ